jgi:hypothetical protein
LHTALLQPGSLTLLLSPTLRQSGELFRDKFMRLYTALGRPVAATQETQLTLLGHRRLEVAQGLRGRDVLLKELQNFRVKITASANETFGAWREGEHDDLVFACAIGCWVGEHAWAGAWDWKPHPGARSEMSKLPPELLDPGRGADPRDDDDAPGGGGIVDWSRPPWV